MSLFRVAGGARRYIRTAAAMPVVCMPLGITERGLAVHAHPTAAVRQAVTLELESEGRPVHRMKQRTAFPPNFVHSLDSTHMMYTSLECKK